MSLEELKSRCINDLSNRKFRFEYYVALANSQKRGDISRDQMNEAIAEIEELLAQEPQ